MAAALAGQGDGPGLRALISTAPIAAGNRAALLDALDHPGDPSTAAAVSALLPVERGAAPGYGYAQLGLPEIVLLHLGDLDAVLANYRELAASGANLDNDGWFLPVYQGFRAHPGFAGVLEGFGLPAYWDQAGRRRTPGARIWANNPRTVQSPERSAGNVWRRWRKAASAPADGGNRQGQ